MKNNKLCKSCSGRLSEFNDEEIIADGFCPYCVDEKGNLKNYGDILQMMIEYIEQEHVEIDKKERLSTAQKWLREGEVWKDKFITDDIIIDRIREGDLERIKVHKHKKEGFSHSCGECMYYQNCKDSLKSKKKWLSKMKLKYGNCANVLYHDQNLVGYIQYAPKKEFPKLEELEAKSTDTGDWYISCIYIDDIVSKEDKKSFTLLLIKHVILDLKKRKAKAAQISAPIKEGIISSTPFNWGFYEKIGFVEIGHDEEYVVGKLNLN
ncbi:hypothetical protein GF357_03575 [Candidatus Dojkabacteria bacterium]|nr:hypothetical protein [Candidatus Dojkabacteria bacterium]